MERKYLTIEEAFKQIEEVRGPQKGKTLADIPALRKQAQAGLNQAMNPMVPPQAQPPMVK